MGSHKTNTIVSRVLNIKWAVNQSLISLKAKKPKAPKSKHSHDLNTHLPSSY